MKESRSTVYALSDKKSVCYNNVMLKRKYIAVLLGAFLIGCGDPSAFDLNEKLNELKERQENCLSSNARFAELVTMLSQEFQEKFSKKEKPFCARCKERLKKIIW